MEYNKIRNKVNKFYNGGQIQKLQPGGQISPEEKQLMDQIGADRFNDLYIDYNNGDQSAKANGLSFIQYAQQQLKSDMMNQNQNIADNEAAGNTIGTDSTGATRNQINNNGKFTITDPDNHSAGNYQAPTSGNLVQDTMTNIQGMASAERGADGKLTEAGKAQMRGAGIAMGAQVGVAAMNAVDNLAMGDKNFGAQSAAIDSAVHGVSGALMSSGNPYAMAAGAALEGANFLTKAGGQTVQGFDVNIENSGFGTLGHMESSSSRDFGAMIGLGGLNAGKMQAKLARRNEQARMAMQAAEISEDIKFEQEARMNSVDNVLRNNQIALAGGIDTNLLGA